VGLFDFVGPIEPVRYLFLFDLASGAWLKGNHLQLPNRECLIRARPRSTGSNCISEEEEKQDMFHSFKLCNQTYHDKSKENGYKSWTWPQTEISLTTLHYIPSLVDNINKITINVRYTTFPASSL
jgi:hypothetical protein